MLEEHRKKSETEENYIEADIAFKRIQELRQQQEMLSIEKKKKQQLDNVNKLIILIGITSTRRLPKRN